MNKAGAPRPNPAIIGDIAALSLRKLPSVDEVLRLIVASEAAERFGRPAVVNAVRDTLAALRATGGTQGDAILVAAAAIERLEAQEQSNLRSVFNLTGTVLHTNLGRAVLAEAAVEAAVAAMRNAVALEFDLGGGKRGDRDDLVRDLLCELTGAEDATVVNNNAAAVLLVLNTLAKGREAIVSRGELIEIGGAFRMPEIMSRAGARLVEVGTTNRTHKKDYVGAIGPKTGLILKVHTSNYRIEGFTKEVGARELAALAHERKVTLVNDLGSGTLIDLARFGLAHEPTVKEAVAEGADLVTFSGDKLLGGPQAGFIVGRKDLVARIKSNPMKRALRIDKIRLAALEATLKLYRDPDRLAERMPTVRQLARAKKDIEMVARRLLPAVAEKLGDGFEVAVTVCASQIGSGALPMEKLASAGLAIRISGGKHSGRMLAALSIALRRLPVPVVGRIEDNALILDLRCLEDENGFSANLARLTAPLPGAAAMIVGTAGHIDHGKTSLVRALTGVDTDRLKEEKARGISIDLGFANLPAPNGSALGFVDVPGHEKFVHNMLAGATGIDFVLLAIAADDGVMPQTREHLAIIDLLDIERGLVVLTKTDLVAPEQHANVVADIKSLLDGTSLANAEIVPVSTVTGDGIDDLRNRLFDAERTIHARTASERFRLAVDRSFTLPGTGTVVTGTVLSGAISTGNRVVISPSGLTARVRSIHAQNRPTERGLAGQRCALNLAGDGVSKDAIERGQVVLDPELHAPTDRIDATMRLLANEKKPITQWMPVRLHHAATEIGARVVLLRDVPILPGGEATVQLVLDQPVAAAAGDRFVVRDTTAQRTIGGGKLLDLRAPARKRRTPERLAQLQAYGIGDPELALAALLDTPPHFVDLSGFARDRALSEQQTQAIGERLGVIRAAGPDRIFALSAPVWLRFKRSLLAALASFHAENPDLPGLGLERVRLQLEPRLPAPAFLSILQGLARAKEIALDGAWVRLAAHEVRLTPEDKKTWSRITPLIGGAERFRPPRVRDIAAVLVLGELEVRRVFKLLARMGKADEVAHDHFFLRTTVAEMAAIVADLGASAPDGQFSAAQFRDRADNGRKVAIQVLEFFDRHGVSLRRGDLRRVNKHRLDLFSRPANAASIDQPNLGRESSPVGRPDFKSGGAREPVLGGFDSLSLPPR